MTHRVRMERRERVPWWTCEDCHDTWRHVPTDTCDVLLAKLEAEEDAGWTTVTAPTGDALALVRLISNSVRTAA